MVRRFARALVARARLTEMRSARRTQLRKIAQCVTKTQHRVRYSCFAQWLDFARGEKAARKVVRRARAALQRRRLMMMARLNSERLRKMRACLSRRDSRTLVKCVAEWRAACSAGRERARRQEAAENARHLTAIAHREEEQRAAQLRTGLRLRAILRVLAAKRRLKVMRRVAHERDQKVRTAARRSRRRLRERVFAALLDFAARQIAQRDLLQHRLPRVLAHSARFFCFFGESGVKDRQDHLSLSLSLSFASRKRERERERESPAS